MLPPSEFIDVGYIALCEAALYYTPDKGEFSTIAVTFIKNKIFKELYFQSRNPEHFNSEYNEKYDFIPGNYSYERGYEAVENEIISKDIIRYLENTLTDKTLLIFKEFKNGKSVTEIAKTYGFSTSTVRWHRRKIREYIKHYWRESNEQ